MGVVGNNDVELPHDGGNERVREIAGKGRPAVKDHVGQEDKDGRVLVLPTRLEVVDDDVGPVKVVEPHDLDRPRGLALP